jgi:hypothetical protein
MAAVLGISKSTAHAGVTRLLRSRLAHASADGAAAPSPDRVLEFLAHGVSYVFPPEFIEKARGIPTGLSAPGLHSADGVDAEPLVWPSRLGAAVGRGLQPLIPSAPDISMRDPALYGLLALVDAVRSGDSRTREHAIAELTARLISRAVN